MSSVVREQVLECGLSSRLWGGGPSLAALTDPEKQTHLLGGPESRWEGLRGAVSAHHMGTKGGQQEQDRQWGALWGALGPSDPSVTRGTSCSSPRVKYQGHQCVCQEGTDRWGMMVGNKLQGFPGSPEVGVPAPDEMLNSGK